MADQITRADIDGTRMRKVWQKMKGSAGSVVLYEALAHPRFTMVQHFDARGRMQSKQFKVDGENVADLDAAAAALSGKPFPKSLLEE